MRPSVKLKADPAALKKAFLTLKDGRDVAALLEVPYDRLVWHLYRSPKAGRYTRFEIPKRRGGTREIHAPVSALRILQAKLNRVLQLVYPVRPAAHGFVPGRSIVTNAGQHRKPRLVLNVDLADFFPTINFGRVRGLFLSFPFDLPAKVATVIAQLCCFDGRLPQGAPTSPVVSNMICHGLDGDVQELARSCGVVYSRYADDLTFSTFRSAFSAHIVTKANDDSVLLGDTLSRIISGHGFTVNPKKVYLQARNSRQEVTGLIVNNSSPNVRREYVREVRALLHAWRKFGLAAAADDHERRRFGEVKKRPDGQHYPFDKVVRGKIEFLRMVRGADPLYAGFLSQYDVLSNARVPTLVSPSVGPTYTEAESGPDLPPEIDEGEIEALLRKAMWVLECGCHLLSSQGTAFELEGVGLVTCEHVLCECAARGEMIIYRSEDICKEYKVAVVAADGPRDLAILSAVAAPRFGPLSRSLHNDLPSRAKIWIGGFPNHSPGATGTVREGKVTGSRQRAGHRRVLIDAAIVGGNSGGPVVDTRGQVVGVAATGSPSPDMADVVEHGVIPIGQLDEVMAAAAK